jgi:hypothetical protein
MGVFDRAKHGSYLGAPEGCTYICMGCEAVFEVQYHSCPSCGGYDVRRTKWIAK